MQIVALVLLFALTSHPLLADPLSPLTGAAMARQTPESCPVPNIVGLTRAAAASRLQESDLALGQVQTRAASQPAGSVIDQQPRACAPRPANGRVNVLVSTGEATRGTEERGGGTSVGEIAVPVGIAVGAAIIGSLLSRRGNDETVVPDLVKLPATAVEETLRKARLRGGEVIREASMTVANGIVISQAPVAGTTVAPESTVNVRVSTGRPMTEVPNLAGLDWQAANARITAARLRMLVTEPQASDFTGLTVVSQVPAAGTRVGLGASVGVALRATQVAGVPPSEVAPALAPAPAPAPALINPPPAPVPPPIVTPQPT